LLEFAYLECLPMLIMTFPKDFKQPYRMNLLDRNNKSYVIKWDRGEDNYWEMFNAEIQNENGERIGSIGNSVTYGFREALEKHEAHLRDIFNSLVLTVYVGWGMDVADSNNVLIGTVSGVFFRDKIMKNSKGDKILISKRITRRSWRTPEVGEHEINSIDGKNIAKFSIKVKKVKQSFWKRHYYFTCVIQINDSDFDRKTLFGMFIANLYIILEPSHSTTYG